MLLCQQTMRYFLYVGMMGEFLYACTMSRVAAGVLGGQEAVKRHEDFRMWDNGGSSQIFVKTSQMV